eukprot:4111019-Prymnesium_polylepis.1
MRGELTRFQARFEPAAQNQVAAFSELLKHDMSGALGIPPEKITKVHVAHNGWVSIDYETEASVKISPTPALDLCLLVHDNEFLTTAYAGVLKYADSAANCFLWSPSEQRLMPLDTSGEARRRLLDTFQEAAAGPAPPVRPGNFTHTASTAPNASSAELLPSCNGNASRLSLTVSTANASLVSSIIRVMNEPSTPYSNGDVVSVLETGLRNAGSSVSLCSAPQYSVAPVSPSTPPLPSYPPSPSLPADTGSTCQGFRMVNIATNTPSSNLALQKDYMLDLALGVRTNG